MISSVTKIAGLAAAPLLLAASWPFWAQHDIAVPSTLASVKQTVLEYLYPVEPSISYECASQHNYTTQIVSVDPLVVYIHGFLTPFDITALERAGDPLFKPSVITKYGRTEADPDRTSHTAFLPAEDDAVRCVLDRARKFSGALLGGNDVYDEMGRPQLVRYTTGQKFNLHYDWFPSPQPWTGPNGEPLRWNRVGSFFAILEDDCDEGETWFPFVRAVDAAGEEGLWRRHPDGGTAFRPVKGNTLFWVNLDGEGNGDERVKHAGLPVKAGRKTAMNIWPRRYFD